MVSAALGVSGGVRAASTTVYPPRPPASAPCAPAPTRPLLTEVEVAALVLGLEEAAPRLGMDVGSLGHQQLHIVFAAAFDGDVQGGLALEEVGDSHQGPGGGCRALTKCGGCWGAEGGDPPQGNKGTVRHSWTWSL